MSEPSVRYVPLQSNQSPNLVDISVRSRGSDATGPTDKASASALSSWRIGWKTPTLMLASYTFALLIAVLHLLFFHLIDGKEADGPNEALGQTYVSTISNVLANIFGFSLKAALAVAFVQYMWLLFRREALKVSTIETLFSIRSNPFALFKPAVLHAAPLLFVLAIIMWSLQVVVSFPPGALTVGTALKTSNSLLTVPTFNASFMGNGSGTDANKYSLIGLNPDPFGGFESGALKSGDLINRLARQILESGDTTPVASPCGANCSYVLEFEGPWIECENRSTVYFINGTAPPYLAYSGQWSTVPSALPFNTLYNGTYTLANFSSSTFTILGANLATMIDDYNPSLLVQQNDVVCAPGRAKFTVHNTYRDNIYSRNVTAEPIDMLMNLALPTHNGIVSVPGFVNTTEGKLGIDLGTAPASWTNFTRAYYRDNNMMTIFTAMMSWLNGEFLAWPACESFTLDYKTNTTGIGQQWKSDMYWEENFGLATGELSVDESAQNGTIIDATRFNKAFGMYNVSTLSPPSFNVTADLINDYLFNLTISMMSAYGQWNTTVNATTWSTINVYQFSRPRNLLLPYFISIGVALPFIVMGLLALQKNGVSAMDGSFIQLITTSTGSAILDREAAGGCLGGEESVPKELKDLKIRFGEFISRDEPGRPKRAGFGAEHEVTALDQNTKYGIERWV